MFFKMRNKNRKTEVILAERARRDPLTNWSKILRKRNGLILFCFCTQSISRVFLGKDVRIENSGKTGSFGAFVEESELNTGNFDV